MRRWLVDGHGGGEKEAGGFRQRRRNGGFVHGEGMREWLLGCSPGSVILGLNCSRRVWVTGNASARTLYKVAAHWQMRRGRSVCGVKRSGADRKNGLNRNPTANFPDSGGLYS